MKKNFLFKGVAMLGAISLLANVMLPGMEAFAVSNFSDDTWTWNYVNDETSWTNSYQNGALKVYYQNNPDEDRWNASATPTARRCNFNDKVYTAQICDDSACSNPSSNVTLTTTWGETYQTVNDGENSYLLTMSAKVGDDVYQLYQKQTLCTIPEGAPDDAFFPSVGGGHSWAEPDWGCFYAVPFGNNNLCTIPEGAPDDAFFPSVGGGHSWAEPDWGCFYAVPFEATNNVCTLPSTAPSNAVITDYVATHPAEGCYYKLPAVEPTACTLPSTAPQGAVFADWMVTDQGVCYYQMKAVSPSPDPIPTGKYVKLLSYSYPDCTTVPTFQGRSASNIATNGALHPWISVAFKKEFNGTIKFNYDNGEDVYPRGSAMQSWGPEGKSRGIATIPGAFPEVTDFDIDKFNATLVSMTDKGEAKIDDGTSNGAGMVLEAKEADTTSEETAIEGKLGTSTTTAELEGATKLDVYNDANNDGTKDDLSALNTSVKFTKAVLVRIPVKSKTPVKIKVMHNGKDIFELLGLAKQAGDCTGGVAADSDNVYTGGEIPATLGYAEIYTCQASTFVAYTETQNPAPTYSGGGGGSSRSSSKTETKAETGSVATGDTVDVDAVDATGAEEGANEETPVLTADEEQAAVVKFGQEQIDAYKWALENGITTMKTVEDARLDKPLTRAELAKMMVVYIQKVLEKEPVLTGDVTYADVSESLGDLAGYIKLAYQYQIMGINADGTPIEAFNPNGLVTRGEYATVFSRVLFGDKFNKEGADFYTNHLAALEKAGVLKDTTPTMKEIRGWVMLMMYRSSQNADDIQAVAAETEETASDETPADEVASEVGADEEASTDTTEPSETAE